MGSLVLVGRCYLSRDLEDLRRGTQSAPYRRLCISSDASSFSFPSIGDDFISYLRRRKTLLCRCRYLLAVAQGFIHFTADPQSVQQYRQFPRHRNYRPFLGVLTAALANPLPRSPQVAVFSMRPQYVVRAVHQGLAQILIPGFGDSQLRLTRPRIPLPWPHTQETSHRPTLLKPLWISDRQHV